MPISQSIDFIPALQPITSPVTKFGGWPVWLQQPATPLSRRTGDPMTFIGQVVVPRELATDNQLRLAYIFVTGAGFDERAIETWNPSEGETCVLIQSGNADSATTAHYPMLLKRWEEIEGRRREVACEYAVAAIEATEAAYLRAQQLDEVPDEERIRITDSWRGNKIGGSPYWIQYEEFPFAEDSKLLLQLECSTYPFNLNLGGGIGYVFIDREASKAAILWQC